MASPRRDELGPDQVPKTTSLSIVYRNIDELRLDPRNPRRHPKKQIKQIAKSLEAFGFVAPCLVDEELRIISGHGRLAAAKLLGLERVPTICITHLTEIQRRAFQIADNRSSEKSTWDEALLAEELQILKTANLDFDLSSVGFTIDEINLLTVGLEPTSGIEPKKRRNEELTNSESEMEVSRPGDLWVLDGQRLLCGNAFDPETYPVIMSGRDAAAVLTHVPGGAGSDLLIKVFSELAEYSAPAAFQFVVADHRFIGSLGAAEGAGLSLVDLCVAVKPHAQPGPGLLYQTQHDLIFVLEKTKAEPASNSQINGSDVWFYPRVRSRHGVSELRRAGLSQNSLPVTLLADLITNSTACGEIVLDPFLGAGATLLAAEQTGRICYAIESDPRQLDRIVRHWQELSGKNAVHEKAGVYFDQMGERRNGRA